MSLYWMTDVWKHSPYKGVALMIHLALADQANDAGVCWPHLPTIIKKARVSRASGYRALRQMQADGLLEFDGEEISRASQDHPLRLLPIQNLDSSVSPRDEPSHRETPTVSPRDSEGRDTSLIEPSVEPSSNRATDVTPVTTEFEYFWTVYPKRVGKGAARIAFSKAIVKTDVETIQQGAERYRDSRAGKDRQYTLNPATWLNQERWDDEETASRVGVLPDAPMPEWMKKLVKEEQ